jgi:membrane protease YdiL (CAAX protease family)
LVLGYVVVFDLGWFPLFLRVLSPALERILGGPATDALSLFFLFDFPLAIVLLLVLRGRRAVRAVELGLTSTTPLSEVGYGALWFLGFLIVLSMTSLAGWIVLGEMLDSIVAPGAEQPSQVLVSRIFRSGSWGAVGMTFLLAGALSPIVEEIYFRGLLYASLRRGVGAVAATGASSLIFAILHLGSGLFFGILYLGVGAILAVIFERRRSLIPGIVFHVAQNMTAISLHNFSL